VFADVNSRVIADEACNESLLMLMKEGMKTAPNEVCNNREHADGAEVDGDFIVIEADTRIDRCYFLFSIFVRVCLCKNPISS